MNEFSGIGYAPGVVRGARSFKIDKLGRLTGIHYEQVWRPGENDAECRLLDDVLAVTMRRIHAMNFALGGLVPPAEQKRGSFWGGERGAPFVPSEPGPAPEEPPHAFAECGCGFYAYYDGSDDYHQEGYVSAVVEGYGETLVGSRGFRCMKARIVALHIPEDVTAHMARLVARNYSGIPLFQSFGDMVSEFPPDAAGMDPSPETAPDFWTRAV